MIGKQAGKFLALIKNVKMFFQAFLKIPMLSSKRGHMTKIIFQLVGHVICLTVRIDFEVFIWEIDPDLLSYGPAFLKVASHQV